MQNDSIDRDDPTAGSKPLSGTAGRGRDHGPSLCVHEWTGRASLHLLEVNSFAFMDRMRRKYGPDLTLGTVPRSEWEEIASRGFSLVWLMGVWMRSNASRRCALTHEGLRRAYGEALPGWSEADVAGSPYAVGSYCIDPYLGTDEDLLRAKTVINELGMGLILDFVPNHLAVDHPWTESMPDCFVQGSREDMESNPELFFLTERGHVLAHGRDPHFPPWSDTAQVNLFSARAREALAGELRRIAEYADGLRCDMAMLAINEVFAGTWGKYVQNQPPLKTEFWEEIISPVRAMHPGFVFIAEAYWGLEQRLRDLGFDYSYDKTLYDLILHTSLPELKLYVRIEERVQRQCLRFIENHDEPRAVSAFGKERSLAAAAMTATLPGLHLFHEGQMEGCAVRTPVQLSRRLEEPGDPDMVRFYEILLAFSSEEPLATGAFRPLDARPAWEGNRSSESLLAWLWHGGERLKLVCVNYSSHTAQGRLRIPPELLTGQPLAFRDALTGEIYIRTLEEVNTVGLFVELGPWMAHLLDLLA
ncbi:MAG: alpha-amylase family glycosyl hydrolase [Pseudomonadota bacterium]|nr:alpha-amylase family glycosyl hydrolase [Pseudomonadota bacterium]